MILFADGGSVVWLCHFGILAGAEISRVPFIVVDEGLLLNFEMEGFDCWGGTVC